MHVLRYINQEFNYGFNELSRHEIKYKMDKALNKCLTDEVNSINSCNLDYYEFDVKELSGILYSCLNNTGRKKFVSLINAVLEVAGSIQSCSVLWFIENNNYRDNFAKFLEDGKWEYISTRTNETPLETFYRVYDTFNDIFLANEKLKVLKK